MLDADKARALRRARTVTGVAIAALAAAIGGAAPSHAEQAAGEGRGPAPIIYASGGVAASGVSAAVHLNNSLGSKPSADASVTFDQFQGRGGATASGVIDLRPGALSATFGPAPSTGGRIDITPRPLASKPLPAITSPSALAEPYAGPPYQVAGKWFVPTHEPNYDETGIASWYGPTFHGKASASGEVFDQDALTAAHPTLPIPSLVRVTNLENGKSVVVRLNDRGPFVDDRIIDLSHRTADVLDMRSKGTAKVRVQYIGPAPVEANSLPAQSEAMSAPAPVPVSLTQFTVQPLAPMTIASPVAEVRPVVEPATPTGLVQADDGLRGFYLQAGSFADLGNAHRLRAKMQSAGPAFISAAQVNGSEFYRVMLGPWTSRAEAERVQGDLVGGGAKAILVARLDN